MSTDGLTEEGEVCYKAWGEDRFTSGATPTSYGYTWLRILLYNTPHAPFSEQNCPGHRLGSWYWSSHRPAPAHLGADVVVNFFRNRPPPSRPPLRSAAMGRRALVVKADIGEIESIEQLFDEVHSELGGLDILIHNAASGYNRPALEQKPKGWDWTMNINARSLLFSPNVPRS